MAKPLPCGRKRISEPSNPHSKPQIWKTNLDQYLKKRGLRATKTRDQIAGIALAKRNHFEIQTLVKEVQAKHPEISPATVYRSVKTLCDAELLIETLQNKGGSALYEVALDEHHDHLICLDCGEIFEFHDTNLEKAQTRVMEAMKFKQVKHRHVIYATCLELDRST